MRVRDGQWSATLARKSSMLNESTFRLLNQTKKLETPSDWDAPRVPRLWRYALHYFDDLNAEGADQRREWHQSLVRRWLRDNRPGFGTGWEPYPLSLRIVNWIKWDLRRKSLSAEACDSLAAQVRRLRCRLEYHLLGNHLWANAKALAFAGAFFDGPEARSWLLSGQEILSRELSEQVLADGGHFERSPMYHAIIVEDILDLINLSVVFPRAFPEHFLQLLRPRIRSMLRWLQVLSHPDGDIAQFNDAAFGISGTFSSLKDYAATLGIRLDDLTLDALEALPESGYFRLQNQRAVLLCDLAPLGPDYLPAHGHADTLCFELSFEGQRVFVNSGTSTYEPGPERLRERQTLAHNTVVVAGRSSSDVWASFRVGRRAAPSRVSWHKSSDGLRLEGQHDGYRRLKGRPMHHRRWLLEDRNLTIEDRIDGGDHDAVAHFHLHPAVSVAAADQRAISLHISGDSGRRLSMTIEPPSSPTVSEASWSPEFGVRIKTQKISIPLINGRLKATVAW